MSFSPITLSQIGFSLTFSFPPTVSCPGELLATVADKMRALVKEKRKIHTFDMVLPSAVGWLRSQQRVDLALYLEKKIGQERLSSAREKQRLIELASIGDFAFLVEGPCLQNTMELGAFELLELHVEGRGHCTILGLCRPSKKEIKELLRAWRSYPHRRHETVGQQLGYWKVICGQIAWLPKGVRVRGAFFSRMRSLLFGQSYYLELNSKIAYEDLNQALGEAQIVLQEASPIVAEESAGLLSLSPQTTWVVLEEEKDPQGDVCVTSLLQRVEKTIKMLGFEFLCRVTLPSRERGGRFEKVVNSLVGHCIVEESKGGGVVFDISVRDGMGRSWSLASLAELRGGLWRLEWFGERSLALSLEIGQGGLKNIATGESALEDQ